MVIVEPEDHFKEQSLKLLNKKQEIAMKSLTLNIPRHLDKWVTDNGGYDTVLTKSMENLKEQPPLTPHPVGVRVTSTDYEWLCQKAEELNTTRSVLLRYLVHTYYEDYLENPPKPVKLKTEYSANSLLIKNVYDEIRNTDTSKTQLWHYCIRRYSDDDEKYLKKYYDRVKVRQLIPENNYYKLKKTGNMNQHIINTITRLYDESLY